MDLRSVLNEDSGNASSSRRALANSLNPHHHPPPPTLVTNTSSINGMTTHSPSAQQQFQQPPTPQYMPPYSPASASPRSAYPPRQPTISPYTPSSEHPPVPSAQRSQSHHSVASTPTSVYNRSPQAHRGSPLNTRPPSQQGINLASFPTPSSHSPTPTPVYNKTPLTPQIQSSRDSVGIPSTQTRPQRVVHSPRSGHHYQIPLDHTGRPAAEYNHQQPPYDSRGPMPQRSRTRSLSVSPKTILSELPPHASSASMNPPPGPEGHQVIQSSRIGHDEVLQSTSSQPSPIQQQQVSKSRVTSESPVSMRANSANASHAPAHAHFDVSSEAVRSTVSDVPPHPDMPSSSGSMDQQLPDLNEDSPLTFQTKRSRDESTSSLLSNSPSGDSSKPQSSNLRSSMSGVESINPSKSASSKNLKRNLTPDESYNLSRLPAAKKARYTEPPLWARSAKNARPLKKATPEELHAVGIVLPWERPLERPLERSLNGASKPSPKDPIAQQAAQVQSYETPTDNGLLGPWEPCFSGIIPYEEVTRSISDFLFEYVVKDETFQTGNAGEVPPGNGRLEIEAKIGTLIDRRDGTRLRLPVGTETVLRDECNVKFESLMSEAQHKHYNTFLNREFDLSNQRTAASNRSDEAKKRVRMYYNHTKETDMFYSLPDDEILSLPLPIQLALKQRPNHRPKLRVTRDQSSGKILAKIVKVRVRDLHVYSPRTQFDWRVSINIEFDWHGDEKALAAATDGLNTFSEESPDRNKDRISYRHIYFQVDLTQVKASSALVHELEVEIESSAVRQQGRLVLANRPNQYEELIKAFADNVRLLVRQGVGT